MTPDEEKAAQEAEARAAQEAAEKAAREAAGDDSDDGLPEDPKVLKKVIADTRREAAARRVKEKELADKLKALEEERRKQQEAALAEQGKFKELAEQRAKELESTRQELEQARATAQKYEAREAEEQKRKAAQVDADFAALPEEIRAEFPDADTRTKEVAIKMYQRATGSKPRPPNNPGTAPRPVSPDGKPPYTDDQIVAYEQIRGNPRHPKREEAIKALREVDAWRAAHRQ